jgi:hypothetical protein
MLAIAMLVCAWTVLRGSSVGALHDARQDTAGESTTTTEPATTGDQPDAGLGSSVDSLTLVSQSNYVAADGVFSVALQWTGPSDDRSISVIIGSRVDRESDLTTPSTILNRLPPVPLASVLTPDGMVRLDIAVRSFSTADPDQASRVYIPDAGVYPVEFEIRDVGGPVASAATQLIRLPTETAEADVLPICIVLPVSTAEGLLLSDVIDLLERHPKTPIAVLLETAVTSSLLEDPELAARFDQALGNRELIVGSTLDLDPSALVKIGHGDLFVEAVGETVSELNASGVTPSAGLLALEPPLTAEGAALLVDNAITTVLGLGVTASGAIDTPGGDLRVVAADVPLSEFLGTTANPADSVHRLLARLAVRNDVDASPVLLGGATLRGASTGALEVLLASAEDVGLIQPITLVEYGRLSPSLPIRPIESPTQDLAPVGDLIDRISQLLTTYGGFYVSGTAPPAVYERALLSALSRDRNPADRMRSLDQADETLTKSLTTIDIMSGQAVTLTAQRLTIPLNVTNVADGARNVVLHFSSDKVKVDQDGQLFELEPGLTTIEIDVEARSLGVSPLDVEATTPDGTIVLSTTRVQIRSTAVPGLGLLLSGAALSFLLGWWIISIGRSRAHRGSAPESEPDASNVDAEQSSPAAPHP